VANNNSILPIQIKDNFEKWGVASIQHDYCYGRHLYYKLPSGNSIPFWIGLDITSNGTFVNLTFENVILNAVSPQNTVSNLNPAIYSTSNSNQQRSFLIERRLEQTYFSQLCSTEDPKIIENFMKEVLGAV
jgi:hypothetical protein